MNKKMLAFAAHPDDETLGCGGTIMKKLADGYDVTIVVMTDGRNALSKVFGIKSNPTPEEMKETRRRELFKAMEILGVPVEKVLLLNFRDGELLNFSKEAKAKVTEILAVTQPTEIYLHNRKDTNSDHRATYLIVQDCIRQLDLPPRLSQY